MDRCGIKLCGDHDSQSSVLLFRKVENTHRHQGSCTPSARRVNQHGMSNRLAQPKPAGKEGKGAAGLNEVSQ
jgi:hypothetical protein